MSSARLTVLSADSENRSCSRESSQRDAARPVYGYEVE